MISEQTWEELQKTNPALYETLRTEYAEFEEYKNNQLEEERKKSSLTWKTFPPKALELIHEDVLVKTVLEKLDTYISPKWNDFSCLDEEERYPLIASLVFRLKDKFKEIYSPYKTKKQKKEEPQDALEL